MYEKCKNSAFSRRFWTYSVILGWSRAEGAKFLHIFYHSNSKMGYFLSILQRVKPTNVPTRHPGNRPEKKPSDQRLFFRPRTLKTDQNWS